MFCSDIPDPYLLIFSSSTPQLLYYSHIPAIVVPLLAGFFVYSKSRNFFASKILLLLTLLFPAWSFIDIVLWTNNDSRVIMLFWTLINMFEVLISLTTFYFLYVFIEKKDVPFSGKLFFFILLLPFLILNASEYNLSGFDLTLCEPFQGPLIYYFYFLEGVISLSIIIYLFKKIIATKAEDKSKLFYLALGAVFFSVLISWLNIVGSITENWELTLYSFFGMPIFIGFLTYIIIKYRAFDIKLIGAQALVIAVIILIGSEFFFIRNQTNMILTGITLLLVAVFGWWLVRSVKEEASQKEQLQVVNAELADKKQKLECANAELQKLDQAKSEFINIASHQLRTPITVIKGVISLMRSGDMDELSAEKRKQFYESAWFKCKKLEDIINDILNANSLSSRKFNALDKGAVDIDLKDFFEHVLGDFETEAYEREMKLVLKIKEGFKPEIRGQKEYLEEAFNNLINNAIKYTPSPKKTNDVRGVSDKLGVVEVVVAKDPARAENMLVSIKDNGIGIPSEEIPKLFKKFSRAENARNMYTDGSGLGLFIVKEIIEGHGGVVWVESELGRGSTFFVSLPIRPTKKLNIKEYIIEKSS